MEMNQLQSLMQDKTDQVLLLEREISQLKKTRDPSSAGNDEFHEREVLQAQCEAY